MDIVPQNPFSLVYGALWDMVATHKKLAAYLKPANRIRFDDDVLRDPVKGDIQKADLPELELDSQSVTAQLFYSSTGTKITRQYAWMISSGDFRIQYLYNIEWMLYCAMHNWQKTLTALKWPIEGSQNRPSFIKQANVVTATNGMQVTQQNRNQRGWSALWICNVEMHFDIATIQSELT